MADEIKLKIVLDDGSVKEGFISVERKKAKESAKNMEETLIRLQVRFLPK